jgi:hypothetical protein
LGRKKKTKNTFTKIQKCKILHWAPNRFLCNLSQYAWALPSITSTAQVCHFHQIFAWKERKTTLLFKTGQPSLMRKANKVPAQS